MCKGDGVGRERQGLTLTVNLMGYKSPRRQTLVVWAFPERFNQGGKTTTDVAALPDAPEAWMEQEGESEPSTCVLPFCFLTWPAAACSFCYSSHDGLDHQTQNNPIFP